MALRAPLWSSVGRRWRWGCYRRHRRCQQKVLYLYREHTIGTEGHALTPWSRPPDLPQKEPTMSVEFEQNPALRPVMNAPELAETLSLSVRSIWRFYSAGKLPSAVRIGNSVRWRREEILAWIEAGCPDRKTWDRMREAK
jgi:predicted DNA-binding transcriptional regulator AlpA